MCFLAKYLYFTVCMYCTPFCGIVLTFLLVMFCNCHLTSTLIQLLFRFDYLFKFLLRSVELKVDHPYVVNMNTKLTIVDINISFSFFSLFCIFITLMHYISSNSQEFLEVAHRSSK